MSPPHRYTTAALAALFILTLVLVRLGAFSALDHHFQAARPRSEGPLFSAVTRVLSPSGGVLCSLLLAAAWWRRAGWRRALLIPAVMVLVLLIELCCKELVRQPAGDLTATFALGIVVHWSFPSGHETRACFLLLVLAAWFPRSFYLAATLVALWLGVELVASGSHFASDVIGGALLGTGAGVGVQGILLSARERTRAVLV